MVKRLLRVVLVAAAVGAILLSSCAAPTPSPSPTPTPTPTPSPSPTPTPTPSPVEQQTFYIGTTAMASTAYPPTVALARVINEGVPELNMVPRECPGGFLENIELIKTGELRMGAATTAYAYFAYSGTVLYKDQPPFTDLRSSWFWEITPFTIFVRKDSGVTDVRQLDGKPFGAGYAGSYTHFCNVAILEDGVGVKPEWMAATEAAVFEAVRNNKVIGAGTWGFPKSTVLELNAAVPLTILSVTLEDLQRVGKIYPGVMPPILMPAGLYPGQDKPIQTFSSVPGWIINKDFPADLVYKMAKAVEANPGAIFDEAVAAGGRFSALGEDWEEAMLKYATIPLHAGMVRYFKEKGITVPDNLIPPEAR